MFILFLFIWEHIPSPVYNNASWKNTFLTFEQMNSEPSQLISWGLSVPPSGFMLRVCREERPFVTSDQNVPNSSQAPLKIFVFLGTFG